MKTALEFPIYVECPKCGSKYDESEVEIINHQSNTFGIGWGHQDIERDIITFKCPRCGQVVKSLRYG